MTKIANEVYTMEKVEMLFGKDNCKIEIQGKIVWAYEGKNFYFESPLTEEDLDTVNNCFAEGTNIVDSIDTKAPTVTASNTPSAVPSAPDSGCIDSTFKFSGKTSCEGMTKKLCKKFDKYGRLGKSHCPKTCGTCENMCKDDEKFFVSDENEKMAWNCQDIPNKWVKCTTLCVEGKDGSGNKEWVTLNSLKKSKKVQLVAEHCRESCAMCITQRPYGLQTMIVQGAYYCQDWNV